MNGYDHMREQHYENVCMGNWAVYADQTDGHKSI